MTNHDPDCAIVRNFNVAQISSDRHRILLTHRLYDAREPTSRNDRVDHVMGMAENPGISLRDLSNRVVMRDDDGLASEILSQLRSQKVPRTNVASD